VPDFSVLIDEGRGSCSWPSAIAKSTNRAWLRLQEDNSEVDSVVRSPWHQEEKWSRVVTWCAGEFMQTSCVY